MWVQSSFDGLIPGLQARKFDVILSSMAATPKRREQIDFTNRLYRNQTRLIAREGSGLLPDAAKLGHKRVAVQQGTVRGKLGFLDTPSGKGFAFAGDVVYDPKIKGDGDAAGMRKSDSDLRDALNVAIAEMLRDGTYRKIERKYFPFDMYGK